MSFEIKKEEKISQLKLCRDKNQFQDAPFFSNDNLKQIIDSVQGYYQINKLASEQTKRLLTQNNFSKMFLLVVLGITPTKGVAKELESKTEFYFPFHENILETDDEKQIILEFQALIKEHLPQLELIKINQENIKFRGGQSYQIINKLAVEKVFQDNPDLFEANNNTLDWLINNPEKWPMSKSENTDDIKNEIRSGLLSGFARPDCEIYAKDSVDGLNLKEVFNLVKSLFTGKEPPPRIGKYPANDLEELKNKIDYFSVISTEQGYKWLCAANLLIDELKSMRLLTEK